MKKWIAALFLGSAFTGSLQAQAPNDRIRLNQVGYYPGAPKLAVVTAPVTAGPFYVITTNGRDTVYRGELGPQVSSPFSSAVTRKADFSPLTRKGSYQVAVPGVGSSSVFRVDDGVHREAAVASLKGYYFMRVSEPLEETYAGKWHRSAGHPDTEVLIHPSAASDKRPAGSVIASPGGWYDAGDYNKYIVNSGITMGTLLSAYEDFPTYFDTLRTNIPESGNRVPDLLDEVVCNLRWMLTMQDPNDGGVYHKCTNAAFDGLVMPGITRLSRYAVQKSTGAALDFAAVTAQAGRILKGTFSRQLPGLGDSCLLASRRAWGWAQQHPAVLYDQNKINGAFTPQITTGTYGDRRLTDEWFWAAAELYTTNGSKDALDTLRSRLQDSVYLPSWSDVRMLGYYTLLRHKARLPALQAVHGTLQKGLLQLADSYLSKLPANAFGTVMGQSARDFIWGSNAVAGNQGVLLVNAFRLTGNRAYLDAALTNMDYILGRNATGYSFLTGIGSKPAMNPHHRPSGADGVADPVPGLLVGGPNPGRQDAAAGSGCPYPFTETETSYTDLYCSYASNEIAINWNAPAVYLANALEALQRQWRVSGGKPKRK